MATFAKIRERWSGLFWGGIAAIIVFLFYAEGEFVDAIRALPQITTSIFGFLLALLGIILQGSGPVIEMMRESKTVYNRFLDFNKHIVFLSFALSIVAYIHGYLVLPWLKGGLSSIYPQVVNYVLKVIFSLLVLCSVWLVVDLMIFVKLFYLLIKRSK